MHIYVFVMYVDAFYKYFAPGRRPIFFVLLKMTVFMYIYVVLCVMRSRVDLHTCRGTRDGTRERLETARGRTTGGEQCSHTPGDPYGVGGFEGVC